VADVNGASSTTSILLRELRLLRPGKQLSPRWRRGGGERGPGADGAGAGSAWSAGGTAAFLY
jgi:hypothetical protein